MNRSCGAVVFVLAALLLFMSSCASLGSNSNPRGTAPSITAQPVNTTVTVGQPATFSVGATGTSPLSYQWRKNSANISSATGANYTTPATTSGDNGAKYDVVVTNPVGSMTSSVATLTVSAAAMLQSIAVIPATPSIAAGLTQQFTATGTYSDNSAKNITTTVTWKSSNTAFATIGAATGLATGIAAGTTQITATQGSVVSPNDPLTVTAAAVTLQSIAVTPVSPSIGIGNTVQFTATGTYSDNSTKNITNSVKWASSNPLFATIGTATGLATGVAAGTTEITATLGSVVSPNDPLTVAVSGTNLTDIVTYHYDVMRTGVNPNETILTPLTMNSATFGKLGEFAVDGEIDGQVLYLSQMNIPGRGTKNVIYAATEKDWVYAFDADSVSGTTSTFLWKASVLPAGESPAAASSLPCGNLTFNGVTATPVIDRGRNAIYVVAMSQDASGNIFQRIHALDLTTGKELFGGPTTISATYPGTGGNIKNGVVTFDPMVHHDRAALLESGSAIYTAWSGLDGDCGNYSAWVIAYNADTLVQSGVIDLVPNNSRAGIWMGGGGPAADAAGNVYLISGNGSGDTPGTNSSFGNSFVKLSTTGSLSVGDYFTPFNTIMEDNGDVDFGSAGPLLLPDLLDNHGTVQHLAIGGGKDGNMYVVSRDNMGKFNAIQNEIHQQIQINSGENFSTPVFFNGTVYVGPSGQPLKAYSMSQTLLPAMPSSESTQSFGQAAVPSISANKTSAGIVWVVDNSTQGGTLFALDANNLANTLYDTNQAAGNRDQPAHVSGHFITPTIANGKVFFGTGSTVAVFGLLH